MQEKNAINVERVNLVTKHGFNFVNLLIVASRPTQKKILLYLYLFHLFHLKRNFCIYVYVMLRTVIRIQSLWTLNIQQR